MHEATTKKLTPLHYHLLSLLKQCDTTRHLKQIHAALIVSAAFHHPLCVSNILRVASRSVPADVAYAFLVLRQTATSNASSWNAVIRSCSANSQHAKAMPCYAQMLRCGVFPNMHTFPLLLKSLSLSDSCHQNQVQAHVLKFGFGCDSFVSNALVSSYANGGDLGSARKLFDRMLERDHVSWTALLHGFVKSDQTEKGLCLFVEMMRDGVRVDEVTIASVLSGAGAVGNVSFGRCVHCLFVECGRVKQDVYVGSALVDMYAKCGRGDDARKVFDEMPCRNLVAWSAMIAGYVHCNRYKDALDVFRDVFLEGLKPNQVTLSSVLSACAQLGALEQGRWVHHCIARNNLGLNSIVETALIDMYAKCGCIDDALEIFNASLQKDVYHWTALINGLAVNGLADQCLDFFSKMVDEGVRPNAITFTGVLSACSHGGLVDEGQMHFNRMSKDFRIMPNVEHYGCMVDLLGRAGCLEEALYLIKRMPMEPNAAVWGALFGACMIHRDFSLGERIGKHLIATQPHRSGRHALLANMYSVSEKWEEMANVRMAMKGTRVDKARACSWLEVNGVLHEFIVLDGSHSQSKDIYEALQAIIKVMKLEDYVLLGATLLQEDVT